jgi:hypothetical protein
MLTPSPASDRRPPSPTDPARHAHRRTRREPSQPRVRSVFRRVVSGRPRRKELDADRSESTNHPGAASRASG